MTSPKPPARKGATPQPPGGRALARSRQFAASRGLPPPDVAGTPPAAPEDVPAGAPARKRRARPGSGGAR